MRFFRLYGLKPLPIAVLEAMSNGTGQTGLIAQVVRLRAAGFLGWYDTTFTAGRTRCRLRR